MQVIPLLQILIGTIVLNAILLIAIATLLAIGLVRK
jgi:hypothetical protein